MIRKAYWGLSVNGELEMTYSDEGFYIEREGVRYESAVDPIGTNREYTETDEKIPDWEAPEIETMEEASDEEDGEEEEA